MPPSPTLVGEMQGAEGKKGRGRVVTPGIEPASTGFKGGRLDYYARWGLAIWVGGLLGI